ncbi:hypothetical protein ACJEBK_28210 [Peribacillus frigoritolerans]|uniref:hypothetical protein n=1 Tax=Peribacillus frigoritolerans TaxID=450367 RepID=UPI0037CBAC23
MRIYNAKEMSPIKKADPSQGIDFFSYSYSTKHPLVEQQELQPIEPFFNKTIN